MKCSRCNIELEEIKFYPHINILRKNIDVSNIPIEILEELPTPHLHCYYECTPCKIKYELNEMKLLSDKEVDNLVSRGYSINATKTIRYWKEWLVKYNK